jgi:hypothetical protein
MTLLDAHEADPAVARKRKRRIVFAGAVVVGFLLAGVAGFVTNNGWWFCYWPQERIVGHFFGALQKQDYKTAYGVWMHDPDWAKHPGEHSQYSFNDFYRDWGPGGEWGLIKTQKVYGASTCPGPSSGVVVDVVVNGRLQHAQVWVEKSDHTLSFSPCELMFQ